AGERGRARGRGARAGTHTARLVTARGVAGRPRHARGRRAPGRGRASVAHARPPAGPLAMSELRRRALEGLPEVPPGDDLPARAAAVTPPGPGVLVVAQKIVSKAEGRLVSLSEIVPSPRALELAAQLGKEPRHTELVLRESVRVVRTAPGVLITETR